MIELPRAALTARRIAARADFLSFDTSDLTQTTWDFSRDAVEAELSVKYMDKAILTISPFETVDEHGRPPGADRRGGGPGNQAGHQARRLSEHGGDPESIHFFHKIGLDYVSCSPFRVPVAKLESVRAASRHLR